MIITIIDNSNESKTNLEKIYEPEHAKSIFDKCSDLGSLSQMSVIDFQELFALENNPF